MKKYELTNIQNDQGLYRIRAIKDFSNVKAGDMGGWVQSEANLSQEGNCWLYDNSNSSGDAWVFGNARLHDYVRVFGNSMVFGNCLLYDNVNVYGCSRVFGNSVVFGNVCVCGNSMVFGNALLNGNAHVKSAIVKTKNCILTISNLGLEGRTITATASNKKIGAGCFWGGLEEFQSLINEKYGHHSTYYAASVLIKSYFENQAKLS